MGAGDAVPAAGREPLRVWTGWIFLAAMLTMALGTVLAILGVTSAGLFLPGVDVLELALLLLAASGVLRAITRDG
jgi:hypothetical protein